MNELMNLVFQIQWGCIWTLSRPQILYQHEPRKQSPKFETVTYIVFLLRSYNHLHQDESYETKLDGVLLFYSKVPLAIFQLHHQTLDTA